MEVIYHIIENDGSIWNSQCFLKDFETNISKKEYFLYKHHIFASFDSVSGELIESDGIYVPYKNNIYLVNKYDLFGIDTKKDLSEMINIFFENTLENPNWVIENSNEYKKEINWASINQDETTRKNKIEEWFLSWMLRRFPNKRDFEIHFEKIKTNNKVKPGVVYGLVDIFLTNVCRKIGWQIDNQKYPSNERDGKWYRLINYFVKFAPLIPVITYKVAEQIEIHENTETTIDFNNMMQSSKEKFYNKEIEKWRKRKRDVKQNKQLNKTLTLEIFNQLLKLENINEETDVEKICDFLEEKIELIEKCALPVDRMYEIYSKYSLNKIKSLRVERIFEKIKSKMDQDEVLLYKASRQNYIKRQECKTGTVTTRNKSLAVKCLTIENSRLFIPIFSELDITKVCEDKMYRSELLSISHLIKSIVNNTTQNLFSLGSCVLYVLWHISNILIELWYVTNIIKGKEIKKEEINLSNVISEWRDDEEKWIPSDDEKEFCFPIGVNLLEKILRFTWKYCIIGNIDILVGLDALSEWISLDEEKTKLGLFIDMQIVTGIDEKDIKLSLHFFPLVKDKISFPFTCLIYADSYPSKDEIINTMRYEHFKRVVSSMPTSKILYRLQFTNNTESVVQSIAINLSILAYLSVNADVLLSIANERILKSIKAHFKKFNDPITKRQETYFQKGKMPSQINVLLQKHNFSFPTNDNFLSWISTLSLSGENP